VKGKGSEILEIGNTDVVIFMGRAITSTWKSALEALPARKVGKVSVRAQIAESNNQQSTQILFLFQKSTHLSAQQQTLPNATPCLGMISSLVQSL
jgi:hypothetical protein